MVGLLIALLSVPGIGMLIAIVIFFVFMTIAVDHEISLALNLAGIRIDILYVQIGMLTGVPKQSGFPKVGFRKI